MMVQIPVQNGRLEVQEELMFQFKSNMISQYNQLIRKSALLSWEDEPFCFIQSFTCLDSGLPC